ncbi:unnamed protein product [Closterium sp. NIES-54]
MPIHTRRAVRPIPPPVPGTHIMALRPSSVPKRLVLPSPLASSLPHILDLESDLVRTASPTVTRLLATVVTDPSFESAAASALVAELVDLAALCHLDYDASLVFYSSCPPTVGGELALGCDVLEDRQFEQECIAATAPHLTSTLLCPEGDSDALDIPTPHSYADAITSPYSSQWKIAMDAEMASWKSIATYVNTAPPHGANIVDGMWIFMVKRPPGSPPAFKAPQRDYELHSLDFSSTFLQGNLHEAICSSCEAEIYAGAMAAKELRWLTYLLTDLGEWPRSPPILYVDNKAMIAFCHDQRMEHRTKHIALCNVLTRELQQRG